jgi:hypothetical protein
MSWADRHDGRASGRPHHHKSIQGHGPSRRFLIGNNRGGINGWVRRSAIFGVVTRVED